MQPKLILNVILNWKRWGCKQFKRKASCVLLHKRNGEESIFCLWNIVNNSCENTRCCVYTCECMLGARGNKGDTFKGTYVPIHTHTHMPTFKIKSIITNVRTNAHRGAYTRAHTHTCTRTHNIYTRNEKIGSY